MDYGDSRAVEVVNNKTQNKLPENRFYKVNIQNNHTI